MKTHYTTHTGVKSYLCSLFRNLFLEGSRAASVEQIAVHAFPWGSRVGHKFDKSIIMGWIHVCVFEAKLGSVLYIL